MMCFDFLCFRNPDNPSCTFSRRIKPSVFLISPPPCRWHGQDTAGTRKWRALKQQSDCNSVSLQRSWSSVTLHLYESTRIPHILKTLAASEEIKAGEDSCLLGSPVRAPKDINLVVCRELLPWVWPSKMCLVAIISTAGISRPGSEAFSSCGEDNRV